jgi:metal-responsive CopG/Arc/MetJ family transcriptional regulator
MIICHTITAMASRKIAITLDARTVDEIDRLVMENVFPNRSRAIQRAVESALEGLSRHRLQRECKKLSRREERREAEAGLKRDIEEWPEY